MSVEKRAIGVIGWGFVGKAVDQGLRSHYDIVAQDVSQATLIENGVPSQIPCTIENLVREVVGLGDDIIFVCVPSPMLEDGSCDTSIVESVVADIDAAVAIHGLPSPIVVIKSTVVPGTTRHLNDTYANVHVCFNPEFLRETSSLEDFLNQDRIIIGGAGWAPMEVAALYAPVFPKVPIITTTAQAAEMTKYVTNCFLSVKVAFANELYQLCDRIGVSYDEMIALAKLDQRLGESHWSVPGPDGHLGFGMKCFPKDLNALMALCRDVGVDPKVMAAAWQKNLEVRPEKDWEKIVGVKSRQ